MQTRDDQILKHIGLYRVSLRAVIEELFFDGQSCDHVIQRLLDRKRIQAVSGLPDNLTYYQLTLQEARSRGVPKDRTEPRNSKLPEDLAVLWFSCMGSRLRPRIDRKPLNTVFGRGHGMGMPHCRDKVKPDHQVVYRIHSPGPDTDDRRLLRDIQHGLELALLRPALAPFVIEQLYGFAVLVDDPDRLERLTRLVKARDFLGAIVHLEEVPGPLRLAAALRERRAKRETGRTA